MGMQVWLRTVLQIEIIKMNIIQLLNGNAGNRPEYLAWGTGNDPSRCIALGQ
jgi:hypothetical protein